MGDYEKCPKCKNYFLSLDCDKYADVVVHIELREKNATEHDEEKWRYSGLLSMGGGEGYGRGNEFGRLTHKQRQGFLTHLLRYAKLLLEECESEYDFDKRWKENGEND